MAWASLPTAVHIICAGGAEPLLEGKLHKNIQFSEDESFWTLEDNKDVVVFLQKENEMEWCANAHAGAHAPRHT